MKNISDIANLAGVSKSTVSRFLNNGPVSPKTKEKLNRIVTEHDYQPNQFAQSLRAKHTNLIGVIIPRMNSHAVDETVRGIAEVCRELNYQLLLNYTGLKVNAEIEALETFSRSKVDGIILMATTVTPEHLDVIHKINVPVILVGQDYSEMHSVIHNDYQAGYLVGNEIGKSQYQKVCLFSVNEDDIAVGIKRKQGIIDGLGCHGIEPKLFVTSFKYEESRRDVATALDTLPNIEVAIGATDSIALAIHKYYSLNDSKQKPLIYGFGGDPMTQLVSPAIKTVYFNYLRAGQEAMRQLQRLIFSNETNRSITIPINF